MRLRSILPFILAGLAACKEVAGPTQYDTTIVEKIVEVPAQLTCDGGCQMVIESLDDKAAAPVAGRKGNAFAGLTIDDLYYADALVYNTKDSKDTVDVGHILSRFLYLEDYMSDSLPWKIDGNLSANSLDNTKVKFGGHRFTAEFYGVKDDFFESFNTGQKLSKIEIIGDDYRLSTTFKKRDGVTRQYAYVAITRPVTCEKPGVRSLTSNGVNSILTDGSNDLRSRLSAGSIKITCNPKMSALRMASPDPVKIRDWLRQHGQ